MWDLQVKNGTWMCIREAMLFGDGVHWWCRSGRVLGGGAVWVGEEGQGGHHGSRRVHGGSGVCKRYHAGEVGHMRVGWSWLRKMHGAYKRLPHRSGNTCKIGTGHGGCVGVPR